MTLGQRLNRLLQKQAPHLPEEVREAVHKQAQRMSAWAYPICHNESELAQQAHFAKNCEEELCTALAPLWADLPNALAIASRLSR